MIPGDKNYCTNTSGCGDCSARTLYDELVWLAKTGDSVDMAPDRRPDLAIVTKVVHVRWYHTAPGKCLDMSESKKFIVVQEIGSAETLTLDGEHVGFDSNQNIGDELCVLYARIFWPVLLWTHSARPNQKTDGFTLDGIQIVVNTRQ